MSVITKPAAGGALEVLRDYLSLLKLRIVLLLDATAVGVMFPAAHGHPRVAGERRLREQHHLHAGRE